MKSGFFNDTTGAATADAMLLLAGTLAAALLLIPRLAEAPRAALATALADVQVLQGVPAPGPDPRAKAPACDPATRSSCP